MRNTFVDTLLKLAKEDSRIYLIYGDLGYSVIEEFQREFPDRCFNAGISEANMVGVAAGLAMCGKLPYVYSIATFATARCYEQIRVDVCYQNLPVRIVGIGTGLSYGSLGPTHHAIEDISLMRGLPNMTVVSPADPVETKYLTIASTGQSGPIYLRLGKGGDPSLYQDNLEINEKFIIGKALLYSDWENNNFQKITLFSTGGTLLLSTEIADILKINHFNIRIISMHTIKPLDEKIILDSAKNSIAMFTIEEHNIYGGLGSAVAEVLSESKYDILFKRFGLPVCFHKTAGKADYLRKKSGLDKDIITKEIQKLALKTQTI